MKSTKKSLLLSTLSLIMCVAVLLGTTYAWFTDSVTSGKNKIEAGNLDIKLTHTNDTVTDKSVAGATDLFNVELWEPGVIAYENFTVSNVGNLDLKYSMLLSAWDYNTLDGKDLRDVIKVATVDGGFKSSVEGQKPSRSDALALSFSDFASYSVSDVALTAGATKTFGVVLFWDPTDSDNNYNANNGKATDDGKPLFLELGIDLVATQLMSETDSFGNDYDKDATNPAITEYIREKATTKVTKAELEDTSSSSSVTLSTKADDPVKIEATVDKSIAKSELNKILAEDTQGSSTDTSLELNLNVNTTDKSDTSVTYDISMDGTVTTTKDGVKKVESKSITSLDGYVTIKMTVGSGLINARVTHSGAEMQKLNSSTATPTNANGGYYYDSINGILYVVTKSFSPYTFTYDEYWSIHAAESFSTAVDTENKVVTISSAEEFALFANQVNAGTDYKNYTVKLTNDIDAGKYLWTPAGTQSKKFNGTFDGQDHTISNLRLYTSTYGSSVGVLGFMENGTVKNLKVNNVTARTDSDCYVHLGAIIGDGYTGKIDNCHVSGLIDFQIKGRHAVGGINGYGYANINNCTVIGDEGSVISVDNSFTGGIAGFVGEGNGGEGNIFITNCKVENITFPKGFLVGGISGHVHYGNTIANCSVKNCSISGTYTSGIAYANFDAGNPTSYITDCELENITVNGTGASAPVSYLDSVTTPLVCERTYCKNVNCNNKGDAASIVSGEEK